MTIKISELANLTVTQANTIVPVVSNITGTLTTVQANIQQLQDYIITNGVSANITALYANAATQSDLIIRINANVTAANLGMKGYVDSVANQSIYGNINVKAYAESMGYQNYGNVNVAAYVTSANSAIIGYIDQANTIQSQQISAANIGVIGYIDQANTIQSQQISAANIGVIGYIDQANTIQSAQVGAANLAITAANVGMKGYVDSQSFYSNTKVATYLQAGNISNVSVAGNVTATYFLGNGALLTGIVAGGSSYSNVQVATYLPTYTGNIANIRLGSSGVLTFADGTTQTTASAGGGSSYGNANVTAYTVSMGFTNFSNVNVAALITTNGLTNYSNVNVKAYTETMGFQNFSNVNVAAYVTTANSAILGYIDQANTIQSAQVGAANLAIIAANLGMKGYVDSVASQSIYGNGNVLSYLTQFNGNIVPSANVTYSLGNVTNRWKDLYLSGNTIFLGDTTITTSGGAVLTPVTRQLFSQSFLPGSTNSAATFTLDRLPTAGSNRTVLVIGVQGGGPAPSYTLTEGVDFTISGLSLIITASYTATNISCTESYSDTGDLITATEVATDTITPTSGDLTVSGNVTVDGDLYVSPTSIYMGNLRISAADGNLKVNTGIKFSDDSVQSTAYSNVKVATYLPTYTGNIANVRLGSSGVLTFADGTTQTTAGTYSNVQVSTYLPTYSGNIADVTATGNLVVFGNTFINNSYVPALANSTGLAGQIVWNANHLYICIATDTWKRANISTW